MEPFEPNEVLPFYKGKRVLLTGHTGFKGSWLAFMLAQAGAHVCGYSLPAPTEPSLFEVAGISADIESVEGDVRDYESVQRVTQQFHPEIVFHLAAQPIVLEGYRDPRYTYETNVMGTVNVLEAVRQSCSVRSVINVTTDKVYFNAEREEYGYVEDDPLDGYDPYSNSKSCSDLVTHSYRNSFFGDAGVAVSTLRAGNVIGGGDFAPNRIVPDCVRAVELGNPLVVRNPRSTRPYQHVLEPLFAYLLIARRQWDDPGLASAYNVGPDDCDCVATGELVELFARFWGEGFDWVNAGKNKNAPHEANSLKLDSSKLKGAMGWRPRWHIDEAIAHTVEWSRAYLASEDVRAVMSAQVKGYITG